MPCFLPIATRKVMNVLSNIGSLLPSVALDSDSDDSECEARKAKHMQNIQNIIANMSLTDSEPSSRASSMALNVQDSQGDGHSEKDLLRPSSTWSNMFTLGPGHKDAHQPASEPARPPSLEDEMGVAMQRSSKKAKQKRSKQKSTLGDPADCLNADTRNRASSDKLKKSKRTTRKSGGRNSKKGSPVSSSPPTSVMSAPTEGGEKLLVASPSVDWASIESPDFKLLSSQVVSPKAIMRAKTTGGASGSRKKPYWRIWGTSSSKPKKKRNFNRCGFKNGDDPKASDL
eukprot:Selendium_serpulae@DN6104_c0_g2_i2.p1